MDNETRAAYLELLGGTSADKSKKASPETRREDYQAAFEEANKRLKETGEVLNTRGQNWAGAARNFMQGLIPGAARIEAGIRSLPSGFEDYSKYKKNAFESAEGYAAANPTAATSLAVTGALAPSLAMYLASPFTGGSTAAAGTANMARAAATGANAARASLAARALRSAATGAGMGATYGFMNDPSEDLGSRLETAAGSAVLGGGLGAATPFALWGGERGLTLAQRILRGASKEKLPADTVNKFVLDSGILQVDPQKSVNADILRSASAAGARDIYDPLYRMNATLEAAGTRKQPRIITSRTQDTPSAAQIMDAARSPEMTVASQDYTKFAQSVKDTPGQGLVANEMLRRNPVIAGELKGHPAMVGVPKGSFEWFQKVNEIIGDKTSPATYTKSMSLRNNKLLTAKKDIEDTMETLFPGAKQINTEYAAGQGWEEAAMKNAKNTVRYMANMPTEYVPAASSRSLFDILYRPYKRGRARELVLTGGLREGAPQTLENALSAEVQAILEGLRLTEN